MTHKIITTGLLLALAVMQASCAPLPTAVPETLVILGDIFISGCAYLDSDDSGAFEEGDEPIVGAMFSLLVAGKAGFGGMTGDDGCAYVTIPSIGDASDFYPMPAQMTLPEGANYQPVAPEAQTLEYPAVRAVFLFRLP